MYLGLSAEHGRGHLVRTVLEGTIFALFDAFDVLRELGAEPASIVLSGGGAQSELWRQIVADVFGLAVKPLLTVEQSALGAAMLAGAAVGQFRLVDAAAAWPTYGAPVEPVPANVDTYAHLLPVFRGAYRKHIDDFETLTGLAG
jgi:xylulokinase